MSDARPLSAHPTAVYMRAYYAKKRAAGLCVRCKEKNDRIGVTYCSKCRQKMRVSTRNSNLRNYGVTLEQVNQLIAAQGNLCALCGRVMDGSRGPACVDHDHVNGRVRGVLDRMCNQALGLLGDDIPGIEAALRYLKTRV